MKERLNEMFDTFEVVLFDDIIAKIDNAPTVELDESVIQEVLDKRCMTAVANEYLIKLHDKRPQGKLNEAIKTIKAVCSMHTVCNDCPMKSNCNEFPQEWKETERDAE